MGTLSSALSREDIETLIEAMDDWEMFGNQEFHMMSAVKNVPLPSEENEEQYEFIKKVKDYYKQREKEIKQTRAIRQEKAIFTKAKLMLIRQDIGIGQLFEPSTSPDNIPNGNAVDNVKLALAEYFIKDMGVWKHYVDFLVNEGHAAPEEPTSKPEKPSEEDEG